MWIQFPFLCSLRISCYAVRHYFIWCASKELRVVFGNVLFRASEMWPQALPDTLPSFDVLVLETDWWCRLRLPAVSTGSESLRKFWRFFDFFINIISNFVHKIGLYLYSYIHVFQIHIKCDDDDNKMRPHSILKKWPGICLGSLRIPGNPHSRTANLAVIQTEYSGIQFYSVTNDRGDLECNRPF
jgi:hypothetical protein